MSKKAEYIIFENYQRKMKSPSMFYKDSESIQVPKDNGKQNPDESHTSKYQKHLTFSYAYTSVCVDDNFSKPFKSYFDELAIYNFIDSMIIKSKYCTDVIQKHFNKELAVAKKNDEYFENCTKCLVCDNFYVDSDVTAINHYMLQQINH